MSKPPLLLALAVTFIFNLINNPVLAAQNIHMFHPQYVKHLAAVNDKPGAWVEFEREEEELVEKLAEGGLGGERDNLASGGRFHDTALGERDNLASGGRFH